jgi:hypothetical protein
MIGTIMTAITKEAMKGDRKKMSTAFEKTGMKPNVSFNDRAHSAATGEKTPRPHRPITIEGIAAKRSTITVATFATRTGAKNAMKYAIEIAMGTAKATPMAAIKREP